jgi:hypothetical protein
VFVESVGKKNARDPKWIKETFNPQLGETHEFEVCVEEVEIDGQKGSRVEFKPKSKKPCGSFGPSGQGVNRSARRDDIPSSQRMVSNAQVREG